MKVNRRSREAKLNLVFEQSGEPAGLFGGESSYRSFAPALRCYVARSYMVDHSSVSYARCVVFVCLTLREECSDDAEYTYVDTHIHRGWRKR